MIRVLSRRAFGLAATGGLLSLSTIRKVIGKSVYNNSGLAALLGKEADTVQQSLDGTYGFLDTMMDAYASGTTVRLVQSYSDQLFAPFSPVAFTYDNAVTIMAYLASGTVSGLLRASTVGKGLIHAQQTNFPVKDGRFAQGYYVNVPDATGAYITPAAFPFYFYSSSVGDQAWAGMALTQLYKRTNNPEFLMSALLVANWIVQNTYDTQGPGGYRFGTTINSSNQSVPSTNGKSTEHNIDTYAFFTMLASVTNGGKALNGMTWSSLAKHALTFVDAMFNGTGGFFYTGTNADQITISTGIIPEDVQTWSYLAIQSKGYGVSLDWVKTNLVTIDTPSAPFSSLRGLGNFRIEGETFDTASLATNGAANDPEAVWVEGTSHTVAALLSRNLEGSDDLTTAKRLLKNLGLAQAKLGAGQKVNGVAIEQGQGIVAATGQLDTGFGYDYFPDLHIGATGWYAIALNAANPFQLGIPISNL